MYYQGKKIRVRQSWKVGLQVTWTVGHIWVAKTDRWTIEDKHLYHFGVLSPNKTLFVRSLLQQCGKKVIKWFVIFCSAVGGPPEASSSPNERWGLGRRHHYVIILISDFFFIFILWLMKSLIVYLLWQCAFSGRPSKGLDCCWIVSLCGRRSSTQ